MHQILIDTAPVGGDAWRQALVAGNLPKLSRALRLGEPSSSESVREDAEAAWLSPAERWMRVSLGLVGETEQMPSGALTALGAGLDQAERPWAVAQPVHLVLGRESLSLADPAALDLTADEAGQLLDAVRPLLDEEGWGVDARNPSRWLIGHPCLEAVVSADPARAIGRNVASWMPGGAAARGWRRLLTEIQMVWQYHPVNEARMRGGRADVNTLWLHGAGRLAADVRNPFLPGPLPANPALWLAAAASGLPKLPSTAHPHRLRVLQPAVARDADPAALVEAMQALDEDAAHAIDDALRDHDRAAVVLAGEHRWMGFELRRARGWQFWRRADAHVLLAMV